MVTRNRTLRLDDDVISAADDLARVQRMSTGVPATRSSVMIEAIRVGLEVLETTLLGEARRRARERQGVPDEPSKGEEVAREFVRRAANQQAEAERKRFADERKSRARARTTKSAPTKRKSGP